MATFNVVLPIKGISQGLAVETQPPATSGDCQNIRPRDVLENRIRIGQRPGLAKAYTGQLGNIGNPVVALLDVTVVV